MMKGIRWIDRLLTVGNIGFALLFFASAVCSVKDVRGAEMVIMAFQVWAVVTVVLAAVRLALEWRTLSWRERWVKSILMAVCFGGAFVLLQMMEWL